MLIMLLKVYLVPLTEAPTSDFITHLRCWSTDLAERTNTYANYYKSR